MGGGGEEKNKVLESARNLWHVRNDVINAFDKKNYPYKDSKSKTKEEKSEEKLGEKVEEGLKEYINSTRHK